jgi:plastocyanin domain-containing protein
VVIPPGQRYSVLLTADAPGEWAFHCHLLYHMMAGMMTKVVVTQKDMPAASASQPVKEEHHHHGH